MMNDAATNISLGDVLLLFDDKSEVRVIFSNVESKKPEDEVLYEGRVDYLLHSPDGGYNPLRNRLVSWMEPSNDCKVLIYLEN